jgi:hypothetical protein
MTAFTRAHGHGAHPADAHVAAIDLAAESQPALQTVLPVTSNGPCQTCGDI